MLTLKEILAIFPKDREKKLLNIKRFSMFEVFFYRSSLWHHELRVFFITNELSKIAAGVLRRYNPDKARVLALVHDDAEIITGDVQLGHKQRMTTRQLQKVDEDEVKAIEELSERFPENIDGYSYKELLYHALRKDCIEAKLVSYADKLDAYGESLHEVLGGNISALRAVINYSIVIEGLKNKYSELGPLFKMDESPLINLDLHTDRWKVHWRNYQYLNSPHTQESIRRETEFSFYNKWKSIVLKNFGDEGVQILIQQRENLK